MYPINRLGDWSFIHKVGRLVLQPCLNVLYILTIKRNAKNGIALVNNLRGHSCFILEKNMTCFFMWIICYQALRNNTIWKCRLLYIPVLRFIRPRRVELVVLVSNGPWCEKTCIWWFANNKGTDQPAHPPSLFSAFVIHILESIISKLAILKQSFDLLASACSLEDWFEACFVGNPEGRGPNDDVYQCYLQIFYATKWVCFETFKVLYHKGHCN